MPPQSLSEFHWIVRLKGSHKMHITGATDLDRPLPKTLCGKEYDPEDRTYAKKTRKASGTECRACLGIIERTWQATYTYWIKQGKPEEDARRATNSLFEIPD